MDENICKEGREMKRIIPIILLLTVFGITADMIPSSDAQPVTPGEINMAIIRGLNWLRAHQNPNGSWGYGSLDPRGGSIPPHDNVTPGDVALTGLCALAFLNHGVPETDPAVANAIGYLLANVRADGAITNGDYPTYQTSIAILPLIATGNPAYNTVISNARDFLRNIQNTTIPNTDPAFGGWGYGWEREEGPGEEEGDLVIRDNPGDWGITPSNPPFWLSPDIWVDNDGDGVPDRIIPGQVNKLFVAVHNIGATQLTNVTVEFFSDSVTAGFDFSTAYPIGTATIPSIMPFSTQVIQVPWNVPQIVEGEEGPFCVGVRAFCSADPLVSPNSVPLDNNIALRNFFPIKARPGQTINFPFKVHNNRPTPENITPDLMVNAPPGWNVILDDPGPFSLPSGDEVPNVLKIEIPATASPGKIGEIDVVEKVGSDVIGGFRVAVLVVPKRVEITHLSAQSGKEYRVSDARPGAPYYVDRDFIFFSLPAPLRDGLLIMTADDDKEATGADFLSFEVGQSVTVYVLHDSRGEEEKGGTPPGWLSDGFERVEGWSVPTSDQAMGYFAVWRADFDAGVVQLGGNADPPASGQEANYVVIVLPQLTGLAGPPIEIPQVEEVIEWEVWNPGPIYMLPGSPYPTGGGHWADLSNTQWAIMALEHFQPPGTPWRDMALVFVKRCQVDDPTDRPGGFIYSPVPGAPKSTYPFGSMTYAGIWSYRLLGIPVSDPRIQGALRWVEHNYSPHENPPYDDWVVYYYYLTMAKALKLCGIKYIVSGGVPHDWYLEVATDLVRHRQLPDGSWVNSANPALGEWSRALCTAYALLTLETGVLPSAHPIVVTVSLTTSPLELHIYDALGRHTGLKDGQVEEEIPGTTYTSDENAVQVQFSNPEAGGYVIVVRSIGDSDQTFTLAIRGEENEEEVYSKEFAGTLAPGESKRFNMFLSAIMGGLTVFSEEVDMPQARISVDPAELQIDAAQGETGSATLDITELSGNEVDLLLLATEMEGEEITLPIRFISFSEPVFSLEANGTHQAEVEIKVPADLPVGQYTGFLIILDSSRFVMARLPIVLNVSQGTSAQISGVVRDKDGNPIQDVTVAISSGFLVNDTTTDENGNFSLDVVQGITYFLRAHKIGYLPVILEVTAPDDLEIVLEDLPPLLQSPLVSWVSGEAEVEGFPVRAGDVVMARDRDGVLCGIFVVVQEGRYGPMPIYGDDPNTEEDEGLTEDEEIFFEINGDPVSPLGPDKPVWAEGKSLMINLGREVFERLLGDVSGNGFVTAFDSTLILLHVIGEKLIPAERQYIADVTGNGEISPLDAAWILRFVVGQIGSFEEIAQSNPAPPSDLSLSMPNSIADVTGLVRVPITIESAGILGAALTLDYDPAILAPINVSGEISNLIWTKKGDRLLIAFASIEELRKVKLTLTFKVKSKSETTYLRLSDLMLDETRLRPSDLRAEIRVIPDKTALLQNFPNPFNPETWIPFKLAQEADVTIGIYDLSGRLVRRLNLGHLKAGYYISRETAAYWDGRNERGEKVASGVYLYQLRTDDKAFTRRMVILK
jgi:hypothetical protein